VSAPSWIEADELIEFNRLAVEDSGEPFGLIDAGLLNGYTFRDPDDLELAELMIAVVDHQISEEEYLGAIDAHVIAR
jgi:hypothetical protein